jgi:hypothetical protein
LIDKKIIKEFILAEIFVENVLLQEKHITVDDIKKAEKFSKQNNVSVVEYFLMKGLINDNMLGEAIALWFGVPYFSLESDPVSAEKVLRIPE